jgi:hypothetical protein
MLLAVLLVALAVIPAEAQMAGPTITPAAPAVSPPGPAPVTGTVGPTPTVLPTTKVPASTATRQVGTSRTVTTKAPATISTRTASGRKGHVVHAKASAKKPVVTHVAHGKGKATKKHATTQVAHRKGPRPSASSASDDLLRPRV